MAAPLREQVLDVLRQAILDFRLKPGQRLIERELIEQVGVSRTTIREVLRELAAEGLVTTIPQKGAIVVVPTAEEAADLYEVRAALEALAARRFVAHADAQQVAELRTAFSEFEEVAHDGGDIRAMLQAKDRFYRVLFEGSGNRSVESILSGLQARVRMLRAGSLSAPGRPAAAVEEIRTLVVAIEKGDAAGAARAAAAHVEQAAAVGLAAQPA